MKKCIVNFHIGRGGRFWNQGHLTCSGVGESQAHYLIEQNFINPEHYDDVLKSIGEDRPEIDPDGIRSDLFDGIISREEFCKKYGIEVADLGDDHLFDGGGSDVGALPDEDGNYHFDFDGEYNTHYGRSIDSWDDLTEKEQGAMSPDDIDRLKWYDVADLPEQEDEEDI